MFSCCSWFCVFYCIIMLFCVAGCRRGSLHSCECWLLLVRYVCTWSCDWCVWRWQLNQDFFTIITPHHMHAAYCYRLCTKRGLCICLSLCWPVQKRLNRSRWAPIRVGPRKQMGLTSLHWNGQFCGLSGPLKSIGSPCCGVCSKRDHSVVNNGMTARLLQPTASSRLIGVTLHCFPWKIRRTPAMRPFIKIIWPCTR